MLDSSRDRSDRPACAGVSMRPGRLATAAESGGEKQYEQNSHGETRKEGHQDEHETVSLSVKDRAEQSIPASMDIRFGKAKQGGWLSQRRLQGELNCTGECFERAQVAVRALKPIRVTAVDVVEDGHQESHPGWQWCASGAVQEVVVDIVVLAMCRDGDPPAPIVVDYRRDESTPKQFTEGVRHEDGADIFGLDDYSRSGNLARQAIPAVDTGKVCSLFGAQVRGTQALSARVQVRSHGWESPD
ncbi:hypothetical protein [Nocardia sp. NBC_00511]|uniref:hypothetical protein n=1 Tax=Nocardia sp. NBC_00511 TaxID=2903591 RepID=UPI0030E506BC